MGRMREDMGLGFALTVETLQPLQRGEHFVLVDVDSICDSAAERLQNWLAGVAADDDPT